MSLMVTEKSKWHTALGAVTGLEKKKRPLWLESAVHQRPYLCRMTVIDLLVSKTASMFVHTKQIKDMEGFIH